MLRLGEMEPFQPANARGKGHKVSQAYNCVGGDTPRRLTAFALNSVSASHLGRKCW
jgi:hypothetical protein